MKKFKKMFLVGILLSIASLVVTAAEQSKTSLAKKQQPIKNGKQQLINNGIKEIVFATRGRNYLDMHWYANFGYYAEGTKRTAYTLGGGLYKINLQTNKLTTLVDAKNGSVRDPQVHYSGEKIIFSYRKSETANYLLYEINCDGTNLKQLTFGKYDDIEPSYFPDGRIIFVSSRAKRWVNCWQTQVAILYSCDANGKKIKVLSSNIEQDNTPWPMPDGRILYTRWEYIDRNQVVFHHLWTANPDGIRQMIYFGNQFNIPQSVLIDAKPLPNSNKIICLLSPGHGRRDHAGKIVLLSDANGPDDKNSIEYITDYHVRDPFPITDKLYLAAKDAMGRNIAVIDNKGNHQIIFELPKNINGFLNEPRPIIKHKREIIIPDNTDPSKEYGTLLLKDVYIGRNMKGVKRGSIKKLLIMEALPKPINYTGSMEPLSWGGTFTLERILGTVPVEEDGSANFQLPANTSIILAALDKDGRAVKRMHSFLTVMPGEMTSCVGCHENRTIAPNNNNFKIPLASKRTSSTIKKITGFPEVINYPLDIQPIWDRSCINCHNPKKQRGGVSMTGDLGPIYSHSYYWLSALRQLGDARNSAGGNFRPYTMYDIAAPLMKKIENHHHDVKLTAREIKLIRLWLQVGAPYLGSYAGLGTGMIGGDFYDHSIERSDLLLESVQKAQIEIDKSCSSCHATVVHSKKDLSRPINVSLPKESLTDTWMYLSKMHRSKDYKKDPRLYRKLPSSVSDQMGINPEGIRYDRWRFKYLQHAVYNLSRPELSTLLLAPLAKSAGGTGMCRKIDKNGRILKDQPYTVFKSKDDLRYKLILKSIQDVSLLLKNKKRWYMKGFKPHPAYIREMIRYGVLPEDFDINKDVFDPYAIDQKYWELFKYKAQLKTK